jgi:hypothetical protein
MNFVAVLYRENGTIVQMMAAQQHVIEYQANRLGLSWLRVDEERSDYDVKFTVVDGVLTPKSDA